MRHPVHVQCDLTSLTLKITLKLDLTVAPGQNVKVEDTWNFFIVLTVRGGQGE